MMASTTPCPIESRLKKLLEGDLPADGGEELIAHIRECASCRKLVREYAPEDVLPASEARKLASESASRDAVLDLLVGELRANPRSLSDPTEEAPLNDNGMPRDASEDITLSFLDASEDPRSFGRLDDYEITGVIGSGGMGIVLKARDTRLERVVAIKVLKPELAANATARRRFVREAQRAAGVTHDHVVTIHAVGEGKGLPYIVMEYIIGVSLDERIRRTGPLKTEKILRIGMQAASGLAAAHAQGLVHRDIKLWDVATGKLITQFAAHGGTVFDVTFLPNGDFFTGGRDSRLHHWKMSDVLEFADKTVGDAL